MKVKAIIGSVFVSTGIAVLCLCGDSGTNVPVEAASKTPIDSLRLDNLAAPPGWTETEYLHGDTTNLVLSIDGEAVTYKRLGMQYYAQQKMVLDTQTAQLLALDFVTVQNAKNMFALKKPFGGAWGTYNPDKVIISCQEFTATVYAQINKYYFELSFSVDGDSVATKERAAVFYEKYLSLIN
jgi:hypothetical protein